jgi:small subunit ribosomal protein S16
MDSRSKRDGRSIEEIGRYNPKSDPSVIVINSERAQYWLGVGAQPSEPVIALLKRTGDWQKFTGDTSPSGVDVAAPKPDKAELFNRALAEADGEPLVSAISKGKRGKKAEEPAPVEEPAADADAAAEPAEAAAETATESAAESTEVE